MPEQNSEKLASTATRTRLIKTGLLLVLVATGAVGYLLLGDSLSLESLASRESSLRDFQSAQPISVYGIAFLVYVAITGLSLPGAAALTLLFGWYFGLVRGVIIVSFASTTGATLAFLLSRYLLRDAVQKKFGKRLASFNQALERDGPFYLFTLRLIPAVPFFVINAVMGLTPIRMRTFWWVSQVGMLAGTVVYVYAGSVVPNLSILAEQGVKAVFDGTRLTQIVFAFAILGAFPLILRSVVKRISKQLEDKNDLPGKFI